MSSGKWPEPTSQAEPAPDPLPNRYLRLSLIFLAVIIIGLAISWIFNTEDPEVATIGAPAPAFEVRNVVGDEPLSLDGLINDEGRPIVINLMASWCGPCRAEIPEISAFADANPDVIVVGVAVEDVYAAFKEFVTEVGPTYPVGFDDGDMRAAYQTIGLPATFFLDSEGNVVDIFNGILNQRVLEERVAATG
jgi:thiol-disulfide isomerase/thioredoxin